jgi:hypothetical protein
MQIDHDPNEKPRPSRSEFIFVTVVTIMVLVGLGIGLKWASKQVDWTVFLVGCALAFICLLAIACRSEWKKRRRLW